MVQNAVSTVHDPTFWQPLALSQKAAQGGGSVPSDIQTFENSQWGRVRTFASARPQPARRASATRRAPRTSRPRSPRSAPRHSRRTRRPSTARRSAGTGSPRRCPPAGAAARLAHDVRLDLALNAALNDAAVSAWGAKRTYRSPRPISMIRYLAFNDQLPLVAGLIKHVGGQQLVLRNGRWVPGARWSPLAPTPPSPGWASGDSAFAYAADEVLTAFTGRSSAGQPPGQRPRASIAAPSCRATSGGPRPRHEVGKLVWRKLAADPACGIPVESPARCSSGSRLHCGHRRRCAAHPARRDHRGERLALRGHRFRHRRFRADPQVPRSPRTTGAQQTDEAGDSKLKTWSAGRTRLMARLSFSGASGRLVRSTAATLRALVAARHRLPSRRHLVADTHGSECDRGAMPAAVDPRSFFRAA